MATLLMHPEIRHPENGRGAIATHRPPWIERPASGEPLDVFGYIDLPALSATGTVITYTVPPSRSGVIRWFANQLINSALLDGDPSVFWQFNVNQGPAALSYGKFSVSLGAIALPAEIGLIRLRENDVISVLITNASIAVLNVPPQRAGARVSGWLYPKDLDPTNIW
jgi:hypothetical protein